VGRGAKKGREGHPLPLLLIFQHSPAVSFPSRAFGNGRLLRRLMLNEKNSFNLQIKENGVLVSIFV